MFTNGSESVNRKLKLFMTYEKHYKIIDFLTATKDWFLKKETVDTLGIMINSVKQIFSSKYSRILMLDIS